MAGKVINYFADGNTAKGYISFHRSNIEGMKKVFILKGLLGMEKSRIMKKIGTECLTKGYNIELMHSSRDSDSVNGIVVPELEFAVVDGSPLENAKSDERKDNEIYFNLDLALNSERLGRLNHEINAITANKQEMYRSAYKTFSEALLIHDEWEKIYIDNMNFTKAAEITEELAEIFFGDRKLNKKPQVKDRFLGAATPKGSVDFINNLTEDINKRYFIKGRPGSGKSTMLRKLAQNAQDRGFDVEVYHCGFDPDSLDMIIIRELGIAVFDSTAPHEYFPERDTDEIVDMYKEAIKSDTDEKYASELQEIAQRYKNKIKEATFCLAEAKRLNDKLEEYYIQAMDFEKAENIENEINSGVIGIVC